jgi:beta-catenin-like protein 1
MMNGNGEKMNGKSSIDDALNRMVAVASASAGEQPAFIPSATWKGSKEGYYFGTTEKGTGYHIDAYQQPDSEPAAVSSAPKQSRKRPRQQTAQDLLEEAERAVDPDSKILDLKPKSIKSAIVSLRKAAEKNELQRVQHADAPENFMESELALFQQISAFSAVAAAPALFSTMLQEGILEQFVPLLSHDNSDVAVTVAKVLVELIDADSPTPEMLEMAKALVNDEALKWSVANLGRLDPEQEEELAGVEEILTLVESLVELNLVGGRTDDFESVAAYLVRETALVPWLFQQIQARQSGRAAEILSLILQQAEVHSLLPDLTSIPPFSSPLLDEPPSPAIDGMEILLQAIAIYRKTQPPSEEECDFLENVCLALASALTFSSEVNIEKFIARQGIELVLRCLKEKVHAGGVALKLLDLRSRRACEHLVEAGGLKYLFPIFIGRSIPKPMPSITGKKERKQWLHMLETQAIQIMYALTRYLTPESPNDAKDRVLLKFGEEECLKCNRLVELLLKYDQKARTAEYKFYRNTDEDESDDLELAALHAKLKGGGDLFHRVGAIAAFCCVGSKRCHQQIIDQLTLQQSGIGGKKT